MLSNAIIRAFDGSLADAEGLLAVEKATFNETPYSSEQVQAMLTGDTQQAWLALDEGQVVGFAAAFPIYSLRGPRWEIDLLAVHPDWAGRGLATRLIWAAATQGGTLARQTRAVVATDNLGSARAFTRAGFRRAGTCELLILRPGEQSPRPMAPSDVAIRQADSAEEVASWLPDGTMLLAPGEAQTLSGQRQQGRLILLLAEWDGQPAGFAELIEVQTLLYRGVWIESLTALGQRIRRALVSEAVNRAIAAGLDEIGMMLPENDPSLGQALRKAGFRSLGLFDWFTAGLPLPGLAFVSPSAGSEDSQSESSDV